jgi:transglutaminase-like putative cysteine protease
MKIEIRYHTDYAYDETVGFSPHIFRLFPKADRYVHVAHVEFSTNADADVQYRRDIFDNEIAFCFYPQKGTHLVASLALELHLAERNPFHFLLDRHAYEFPFQYKPHEQRVLAPYLQPQSAATAALPFWEPKKMPTLDAIVGLNEALHKNIAYERRDEGVAYEPAETLEKGRGACRDYAVLLAETLRANGIAARLASGYLCEFGEGEKHAEGALHAWTEALLPGAGWVGLDPTNGVFCNENHITAAVGLLPDDISPVTGSYYNKTVVPSKMDATLELIQCET